jgi:hypothetical protein
MQIGISRQLHDQLLKKNVCKEPNGFENAIHYMISKYKHQWTIDGVWFYGVTMEDIHICKIN